MVDLIDDGRASLRVARGRDDAGGLVQQHVREPLLRDGLAVDLDDVGAADERVQLAGLAVHAHAPGLDQLVGLAPGRDAGTGEVRVQPHGCSLPPR